MGSNQVTIRLSDEAWARYSAQAETRGVALSTFLRQRLERQDEFLDGEFALRARPAAAPEPARPRPPRGELIEILLMLRQLVGRQKSALAQSEVARQGLETWDHEPTAARR